MSKRKGISVDEKRTRILQIFYERREFFTLKEVEKIASKEKGVVIQTVKDILQALVDDGLVRSDKIGRMVFFWAFPGENITALEGRISHGKKYIVETEYKLQKIREEIEKEKMGKEDTEERKILMQKIQELTSEKESLEKQITKFSDIDPDAIAKIKKKAQLYKDTANTWTDNIFAIRS